MQHNIDNQYFNIADKSSRFMEIEINFYCTFIA